MPLKAFGSRELPPVGNRDGSTLILLPGLLVFFAD